MNVNIYTSNAFAKTKEGGNGAGVVLEADLLSVKQMKSIAAILGFSETAFIMKSDIADFKVRFFTPAEEVDLCGHATIASYFTMASLGLIKPGIYKQETKAGVLGIEIRNDNTILMHQPAPIFFETIDKRGIADSLNISELQMSDELKPQMVSTGLRDIMVPVKSLEVLNSIKPDMEKIKSISQKYGVVGYHVFSLDSIYGANAHCRNFAPLYDIPEESATGTSNGALACYLYRYQKIRNEQALNIVFEQGYSMNKPSEILVSLTVADNEISEVKVGGIAMNLSSVTLQI